MVVQNMLRIIRSVNANANDSHIDSHMHYGVDRSDFLGSEASKSEFFSYQSGYNLVKFIRSSRP